MQKGLMIKTWNFNMEAVLNSSVKLHQWEMHVFFPSLRTRRQVMRCLTADKSDTFSAPANQTKWLVETKQIFANGFIERTPPCCSIGREQPCRLSLDSFESCRAQSNLRRLWHLCLEPQFQEAIIKRQPEPFAQMWALVRQRLFCGIIVAVFIFYWVSNEDLHTGGSAGLKVAAMVESTSQLLLDSHLRDAPPLWQDQPLKLVQQCCVLDLLSLHSADHSRVCLHTCLSFPIRTIRGRDYKSLAPGSRVWFCHCVFGLLWRVVCLFNWVLLSSYVTAIGRTSCLCSSCTLCATCERLDWVVTPTIGGNNNALSFFFTGLLIWWPLCWNCCSKRRH